jgi:hypothetical protein
VSQRLDELIAELEQLATSLRAGELDAAEAAQLVDRCAEVAARVGSELDELGRAAERESPGDGQEQLH